MKYRFYKFLHLEREDWKDVLFEYGFLLFIGIAGFFVSLLMKWLR